MCGVTHANTYKIDPTHSFVQWRVKHLGYSWLYGRFNDIKGSFSYDADEPSASSIEVIIDLASIDSNHAERDKHLRGEKYLNTDTNKMATFESIRYNGSATEGQLTGNLTLNGVSKEITIPVKRIGMGDDPWGGFRVGFEGAVTIDRRDYGYTYDLGENSNEIELQLGIEGIARSKKSFSKQ